MGVCDSTIANVSHGFSKTSVANIICQTFGISALLAMNVKTKTLTVRYQLDNHSLWTDPLSLSLLSCDIVLMCTNVINLLNHVPEHDCLTFLVLHKTKCK